MTGHEARFEDVDAPAAGNLVITPVPDEVIQVLGAERVERFEQAIVLVNLIESIANIPDPFKRMSSEADMSFLKRRQQKKLNELNLVYGDHSVIRAKVAAVSPIRKGALVYSLEKI